jgi:thiamine-monophosphate kinase
LDQIGEDALVARLVKIAGARAGGRLVVGPGDDCAVVDTGRGPLQLLKTDAIVEGVHFLPRAPAEQVGWKAAARVMSDFAAMGGRPREFLVTLALRPNQSVAWAEGVYRGLRRCLSRHGGELAGGETVRVPATSAALVSVAATGEVGRGRVLKRGGGRPGDVLAVTGRLGGSIRGRHLRFVPRLAQGAWLAGRGGVRAMMDLSDGLAVDLPRLAAASGCGFRLDATQVPRNPGCSVARAVGDGEDYELLLAVAPRAWPALERAWCVEFPKLRLTAVGRLTVAGATPLAGGWDHFR